MTWDEKLILSRELRQKQTKAGKKAWEILRNRKINNYKFKRQYIIKGFIVDFYCAELKLIIEIDGSIHKLKKIADRDRKREIILKSLGLKIIRIKNEDIINNPITFQSNLKQTLARKAGEGAPT